MITIEDELFEVALSFDNDYPNDSCIYIQILAEVVYNNKIKGELK